MLQAVKEAKKAFDSGEVPVGAVVVMEHKIISRGHNQVERLKDPTAHAEMIALTSAFNFILLLSTLAVLPVYTFTAAAEMMLLRKDSSKFNIFTFVKSSIVALLAFAYSIYAIYGTGAQIVMYGFILILIGIPFYIFIKLQNKAKA